jgi:hypothetical protein
MRKPVVWKLGPNYPTTMSNSAKKGPSLVVRNQSNTQFTLRMVYSLLSKENTMVLSG